MRHPERNLRVWYFRSDVSVITLDVSQTSKIPFTCIPRFAKATIWLTPRRRPADRAVPAHLTGAGRVRPVTRGVGPGAGGGAGADGKGVPRHDARPPPPLRGRQNDRMVNSDQVQPPSLGYQVKCWVAESPLSLSFSFFPPKWDFLAVGVCFELFCFNFKSVSKIEGAPCVVLPSIMYFRAAAACGRRCVRGGCIPDHLPAGPTGARPGAAGRTLIPTTGTRPRQPGRAGGEPNIDASSAVGRSAECAARRASGGSPTDALRQQRGLDLTPRRRQRDASQ